MGHLTPDERRAVDRIGAAYRDHKPEAEAWLLSLATALAVGAPAAFEFLADRTDREYGINTKAVD